jgi:hypothetical protein
MSSRKGKSETFVIRGTIQEQESLRPLPNLIVRAFDRDWVSDDKVGFTTSDENGRFEIRFRTEDFRDFVEQRPDLYLRVYDASGTRLLHETTDAIRRNASREERYEVLIPAVALDPRPRNPRSGAA